MLKFKTFSVQLFKNHLQMYKFSTSNQEILDRYKKMVQTGAILEDEKQINAIKNFDSLRNTILANQNDWYKFTSVLKNDLESFNRRVELEAQKGQGKTKDMFDGMEANNKYQKKGGVFGMLQSNTQPIWKPIKDHNMTSHNKVSHRYDFTEIEKYNLKKHKGLYVHGEPGSGKTFLMDIFYDSIPIKEKYRIHFNQFISDISQSMKKVSDQGIQEPQKVVALQKCLGMRLLCLDEFQVTDIANALILKSLFEVFIKNNVIIVATSNRIPDDLYKGGLQRELFMPFIPFLKENTNIINVQTRDYRLLKQDKIENYFYPLDLKTQIKILDIYENIAGQAKFEKKEIEVIEGRSIVVKQCFNGVANYTFKDIILEKYGSTDYIALAKNFHTFILTDVPEFTLDNRDALRRFITFVDILYDASAKLYITAAKKFEDLMAIDGSNYKKEDMLDEAFTGHDLYDEEFAFQRTISRVTEMQTKSYQDKPTLYHRLLEEKNNS